MFLVKSQDEFVPRVIDESDFITNGLQVEAAVEHASVFCESMREENVMVNFEDETEKAAPDAPVVIELLRIVHELWFDNVAGELCMPKA